MQYVIRAQPRIEELTRFWELLNDGTIARQEPDGQEIIASMKRAVMSHNMVEWNETCFCNPPLRHERTTIYDQFFQEMEIQPIGGESVQLKGEPFWDYLQKTSRRSNLSGGRPVTATQVNYVPLRLV